LLLPRFQRPAGLQPPLSFSNQTHPHTNNNCSVAIRDVIDATNQTPLMCSLFLHVTFASYPRVPRFALPRCPTSFPTSSPTGGGTPVGDADGELKTDGDVKTTLHGEKRS